MDLNLEKERKNMKTKTNLKAGGLLGLVFIGIDLDIDLNLFGCGCGKSYHKGC